MTFSPEIEIGMRCKEHKTLRREKKMRNENQVGVNQNYQPSKKLTTSKKTNELEKRK